MSDFVISSKSIHILLTILSKSFILGRSRRLGIDEFRIVSFTDLASAKSDSASAFDEISTPSVFNTERQVYRFFPKQSNTGRDCGMNLVYLQSTLRELTVVLRLPRTSQTAPWCNKLQARHRIVGLSSRIVESSYRR